METNNSPNAPQKYALYMRVSTIDQQNENQKIALLKYATANNIKFDLYEEKESTRKTRPVKQTLLQKLRNKEYCGVIVLRLDRWARSTTELLLEIKELTDKGIRFISLSDNLDFGTAVGQLHLTILSAFAQFERSLISERTKAGLERVKLTGRQLGRPKGSKDKAKRRLSGYLLRQANLRKAKDENGGVYKELESYIRK